MEMSFAVQPNSIPFSPTLAKLRSLSLWDEPAYRVLIGVSAPSVRPGLDSLVVLCV